MFRKTNNVGILISISLLLLSCNQQATETTQTAENNTGEVYQEAGDGDLRVVQGNEVSGDVVMGDKLEAQIYKSAEYQDYQAAVDALDQRLAKTQQRLEKYPDDESFQQELLHISQEKEQAQKQLDNFKKEIIKLADNIRKIPLNTQRLQRAVTLFNEGKYREARIILEIDAPIMQQELDALLSRKEEIEQVQKQHQQKLEDKAEEYVLLAQLTAINYSLKDKRIEKASAYFELALKAHHSPKYLFKYAYFLQKNNQFKKAIKRYQETLEIYRTLAKDNPQVYLPDVSMTLNNLGVLVKADTSRRAEAETHYQEAFEFYRGLAKDNPQVYLPYVATSLNNLGLLVADDTSRRAEAETHYQEALSLYRGLAKDNPQVYLPDVAGTVNNLGLFVADDTSRRVEAETHYQEALQIRRGLAKDNPQVYLPDVAGTVNNLANLLQADTSRRAEAETYYQEALSLYRGLAKDNPQVYLPYVATSLNNLAALLMDDTSRRAEAETHYQEALSLYRGLAKDNPQVYLPYVAGTVNNLANLLQADTSRRAEAETHYQEALSLYRGLAKDNPQVYLPDVATSLNNLAALLMDDTSRRAEAETHYQEALSLYRGLAKDNPQVYLPYVAGTVNNLANLLQADTSRRAEAETHYQEALSLYRGLAKDNPQVYLPDLANTLGATGMAYLNWGESDKAAPLLKESIEIFQPYAQRHPMIFGNKQAYTLLLSIQANENDETYACEASKQGLQIVQMADLKTALEKIKQNSCSE